MANGLRQFALAAYHIKWLLLGPIQSSRGGQPAKHARSYSHPLALLYGALVSSKDLEYFIDLSADTPDMGLRKWNAVY